MPIREIQESDIPALTHLCRLGLEYESMDENLVREKTIGAKNNDPALGLVYEEDGRITAFAQGTIGGKLEEKVKGCVRIFCVDRAYRRTGHGNALFNEIEIRLKDRGAQVVTIMDSPANYLTPGVDFRYTETYCFLLSRGYTVVRENHNLKCELSVDFWPDLDDQAKKLAAEDMEVRRARPEDWPSIKVFLEQEWASWIPEVQGALENKPSTLHIAVKNGKTVAFAAFQGNNKSLPWFGPMGTSEVLRGRGAGAVLLRLCLRDLAQQGWDHAIIPWVGPVAFYARFCNAKMDRSFWVYKKEL